MTGYESKKAAAQDKLAQPAQEPVCPACKAEVLYECVACSSNNYPAQPAQEPIGEVVVESMGVHGSDAMQVRLHFYKEVPLIGSKIYTTPPQRDWVDLTDEQIADYLGDEYHVMTESELRFFRLGEVAAKEKNT